MEISDCNGEFMFLVAFLLASALCVLKAQEPLELLCCLAAVILVLL